MCTKEELSFVRNWLNVQKKEDKEEEMVDLLDTCTSQDRLDEETLLKKLIHYMKDSKEVI